LFLLTAACSQLKSLKEGASSLSAPDIARGGGVADVRGGGIKGVDVEGAVSAGKDLYKAASLSDEDLVKTARQYANYSDSANRLMPAGDAHSKRLDKLAGKHLSESGMKLNFKTYLNPEVNAFSLPDGSIRFYSGLLDMMTDDEARFVLGHEIGHIKLGHSKKQLQVAYAASAMAKAAGSVVQSTAGELSTAVLAALGEALLNSQFSQSQEEAADDYGFDFMAKHGYPREAAISALGKLASLNAEHGFLSSHPAPKDRAERLTKRETKRGAKPEVKAGDAAPSPTAAERSQAQVRTPASAAPQPAPADAASNAPIKIDESAAAELESAFEAGPKKALKETSATAPAESVLRPPAAQKPQAASAGPAPGWYVQISSHSERIDAEVEASAFAYRHLGPQSAAVHTARQGTHGVVVGPYASRAEAQGSIAALSQEAIANQKPQVVQIK
jgi:metalloprotease